MTALHCAVLEPVPGRYGVAPDHFFENCPCVRPDDGCVPDAAPWIQTLFFTSLSAFGIELEKIRLPLRSLLIAKL